MKNLNVNGGIYQADRIIKTDTNIIGYDSNGNELFAFKGISDFTGFTLEEGQTFDIPIPTNTDLQTQIFNLTTQLVNGGAI